MDTVAAEFHTAIAASTLTAEQQAELTTFAETVAGRVVDYLVVRRLAESAPMLLATLALPGCWTPTRAPGPADAIAKPYLRKELHLDRPGPWSRPGRALERPSTAGARRISMR